MSLKRNEKQILMHNSVTGKRRRTASANTILFHQRLLLIKCKSSEREENATKLLLMMMKDWFTFWRVFLSRWQFHQHFTISFCANILAPKTFKAKLQVQSFFGELLLAQKLLIKCWWNWPQEIHSSSWGQLLQHFMSSFCATECVTDLDLRIKMITFDLILTTFEASINFLRQLGQK